MNKIKIFRAEKNLMRILQKVDCIQKIIQNDRCLNQALKERNRKRSWQ